jgi:endonuclease/exonuclease/phosphatase (EEP) superfamily protein YafD
MLVKDDIYNAAVNLQTSLQTHVIYVNLSHLSFMLCNMYIPPAVLGAQGELTRLFSQLPTPFIILGDFNAKNILWGSDRTDETGRMLSNVCAGLKLILLNTIANTHLSLASSALDITSCSPCVAIHLEWSVLPDLYCSDHYPRIIHFSTPWPNKFWHLNQIIRCADWVAFSQSVILEDQEFPSVDSMMDYFMGSLL